MLVRWLSKWHPQARLAVMFLLVFLGLQVCYIGLVLTIPTTLNSGFATLLLVFTPMWFLMATLATMYLLWNAYSLQNRYWQRPNYTTPRNLVVVWLGPLGLAALIFIWFFTPLVETVFEIRRDMNFDRSRDEMIMICDAVFEDGSRSEYLRDNIEVGVFTLVRVSLRNDEQQVWFDVGDASGEVGYICLQDGASPPEDNEIYTFEQVDDQFYFYLERDESRIERQQQESDE